VFSFTVSLKTYSPSNAYGSMKDYNFYHSIIQNSPVGFAHHEIVLHENGQPFDYRFVDVNPAFEKLTGLKKEILIGKTVSALASGFEKGTFDWKGCYGKIDPEQSKILFEQFDDPSKKSYNVQGWWDENGFITLFFTELPEKKPRFESLIHNFPGIAYRCKNDDNYTMLYLSANVETVCGYSANELLHNETIAFVQLIHADDRKKVAAAIASGIEKNQPWEIEYRLLHKNGNIRWVYEKGQGVFDEGDAELYLDGYIMDISRRKQADEENRVLADIVRKSRDFIGVADPEGKAFFVNPAGKAMVGLDTENEETQTVVEDYFFPEDMEFVKKEIMPTVMKLGRWAGEFQFRHFKTGEPVYVYYDLFLTLDPSSGKVQNLSTVTRNITDRKHAEEAIFKSESITKALLDGIPESAFLTDTNGTVIAANATVARRLNQKKEDFIGSNIFEAIPKDVADLRRMHFDKAIKTGKQVQFQDVRFDRMIDNRINPIINKDGKISTVAFIGIDITGRMQAAKALEESEHTFRKLFEDSADAILLIDENNVFVECNQATLELLKMTRDQFLFLKPEDISPEFQPSGRKSAEAAKELIELAYKNEGHRFDWTHINSEGREFIVDISLMPIVVKGKTMLHSTWRNVTERIKVEKALTESLKRFDTLITKVPVGVYILWFRANGQMEFEYVSDQWCRLHQISREEALADVSQVNNMIHEDDVEGFLLTNQEAARNRKKFIWEGRFVIGGEERWFHIESNPEFFSNGDSRWYGVSQEITKRKQAEEALRQSEEKFRSLADSAKVLISIVAAAEGENYLYVNEEWSRVLGYSKEDAKNLDLSALLSPESRQLTAGYAAKRIRGEQVPVNYEISAVSKNGEIKYLDFSSTIINFDNQKAFLTTAIDITGRKLAEQALRESEEKLRELNAQKDKFFSIIAHDLKSPFNAIMGFSDLLVEQIKEKDYDGIDQYASIILKSSQHAIDLLMNLLDWARAQTGRIEFNPEYFELLHLTNEIFGQLNDAAAHKSIELRKDLPSSLPVFADKNMIATVVRNLISNAIKYTGEGGEIILSAKKKPDEILISVKDNGMGIAPDRINKLFRIDTNVSTPGTNKEKGTGLGLILCKEFIEKHDGKIWVESAIGQGSVFSFSIPLKSY
jgi:PAS domain S-box-containing protein